MGLKECMSLGLLILSLSYECNGQGLFNVSATVNGDTITVNIIYDITMFTSAMFQCQLDNGDFEPCSDGFVYTSVPVGTHTITVMGDLDGSSGTAVISGLSVLLPLIVDLDVAQNSTSIAVTITANQEATFECQVDDGAFVPCVSPFVVDTSSLSAGIHNITIRTIIDGIVQGIATQPFEVLESVVIVEFKDSTYSVLESDRIFNVTLIKQGNSSRPISINITLFDDTTNIIDRDEQSRVVIFSPGNSDELSVEFTVRNDNFLERNETFFLNLSFPEATDAQLGARSTAVVTIINDDRLQLLFFQESITVDESVGTVEYPFSFGPATKATQEDFLVIVETFDLVPTDARAGEDYQPNIENFTLGSRNQVGIPAVTILDDTITERAERFGARIIIPQETQQLGIELGTPSTIIITISDDDEDDLEITCYTVYFSNNRSVQLFFEGNQEANFSCAINNNPLQTCTSPTIFQNVVFSDSVTVTVRGVSTLRPERQNKTLTKDVLLVEGHLQVTGIDQISVSIRTTKDATIMCRLNDREPVDCVDGQVFRDLDSGTYTVVIVATGVNNTLEVATDIVGPVVISGIGSSASEAIAACFGRKRLACDSNGQNCEYTAMWRTRGNRVIFTLQAALQGWVAIGFSRNNIMPDTDIIVGAANNVDSFVDDRYCQFSHKSNHCAFRYAVARAQPLQDTIQNIDDASASFVDGNTIVEFSREKVTNDTDQDITIDVCRYVLFAWGDGVNFGTQEIQYHGTNRRNVSETLICFPSEILCPEQFICPDPGSPVNGGSSFTDELLEGSVVSYTCDTGFTLTGTIMQTCVLEPNGTVWRNGSLPTCTSNNCGDPGRPENGNTFGDGFSVGAVVNHTCNIGFVLIGASERECLPSGNWSEPLPTCDEINCGDPGTPTNGDTMGILVRASTSDDLILDTTLGAIVNHTCDEGFVIQGAMERECLPSGEWSEPLPSCIADCGNPGIPENGNTAVSATTAGAVVNHTCNTGFMLRGAARRECLLNGNWSEPLPVCVGKPWNTNYTNAWDLFIGNITRFGGPVFKVPIHIDQTLIDENPDLAEACLCYEVQGRANRTFNLLSDTCVSVNALYQAMDDPTAGNVVNRIGITAIDQDGTCHRIEASLENCSAIVDQNSTVEIGSPYSNAAISVIRYKNRVRISVPNCGTRKQELVIWFICKTMDGQQVSEFVIAKGVNLQPTSHGLIGQFWNIPVGVNDFQLDDSEPYYIVDVNPFNAASRTFVALLNDLPKHVSPLSCLQVGNSQGGATDRFSDPNDSVIEGTFDDYEVADLFNTTFTFSRFSSICVI